LVLEFMVAVRNHTVFVDQTDIILQLRTLSIRDYNSFSFELEFSVFLNIGSNFDNQLTVYLLTSFDVNH